MKLVAMHPVKGVFLREREGSNPSKGTNKNVVELDNTAY